MNEEKAKELSEKLAKENIDYVTVKSGMDGLVEAATMKEAETIVVSVVGNIGIKPTYEAILAKKEIALATKEVLVSGGELIKNAAKENGVSILPIDSEHSAIFPEPSGKQHE